MPSIFFILYQCAERGPRPRGLDRTSHHLTQQTGSVWCPFYWIYLQEVG